MKKVFATVLALIVAGGGAFFVANSSLFDSENLYTNNEAGLSFEYPADWEVVSDGAVNQDHYQIRLKREGGEIIFSVDVNHPAVGGFTLSEESQSKYQKLMSQNGTAIWRPANRALVSTTTLQRLSGQPVPKEQTYGDSRAFKFIFPSLNQINNVGETFDGGSSRLQKGSSTLAIIGGVQTSGGLMKKALNEMDQIVRSLSFQESSRTTFATTTQSADTTDWQMYSDEEYNFSLAYPDSYHEFSRESVVGDEAMLHLVSTSSETALTSSGYNQYPKLDVRVFPLEEYEYNALYGSRHYYDPDQDRCVVVTNGEENTTSFDISTDDWRGCRVATGDAGYSSSGYFIPHEEQQVIIEVTETSYHGTSRSLNFKLLVKTLELDK